MGDIVGRCTVVCSVVPQPYAVLSINNVAVLTASCRGMHAAAVSSGAASISSETFTGADGPAAAARWVNTIPDGALIMLAVIEPGGGTTNGCLGALASAGLGCPS